MSVARNCRRVMSVLLVLVFLVFGQVVPVGAITQSAFDSLDHPYYNPITASCSSTEGASGLVGSNPTEQVYNFLISRKINDRQIQPFHAAGIIGNMIAESGVNPRRVEGTATPSGDSDIPDSRGYGIVQFTPGTKIVPAANKANVSPGDLLFQLNLLISQLEGKAEPPLGSEKAAGDRLMDATDAGSAAEAFMRGYERPRNYSTLETRKGFATDILTKFGSNSSSTGGSTGAVVCETFGGQTVGNFTLPVNSSFYKEHKVWFTKPHHDYPAADLPLPEGTPVYAVTSGTIVAAPNEGGFGKGVTLDIGSGIRVYYGHGSDGGSLPGARKGDTVKAGQLIMHSSWTGSVDPPGPGGTHLHFEIKTIDGKRYCPQTMFVDIAEGRAPNIQTLPTGGCSY